MIFINKKCTPKIYNFYKKYLVQKILKQHNIILSKTLTREGIAICKTIKTLKKNFFKAVKNHKKTENSYS